jgi:Arc/MetJ family transcription regulator
MGIRHEDTVAVTETGCENLCPKWSGSPRSRRWCEWCVLAIIVKVHHLHLEASVRTTLNIDDAALAGAMKTASGKTKTAVINEALWEYARRRRVRRLLAFRGKARWEGDLDDLRGRGRAAG